MASTTADMSKNKGCKITLFWLDKSRAQTIVWLLEELGVKYELKLYHRSKEMLAPPELKEGHELGKSPVVHVESADGRKVVLAETVHIVRYLIEHFGPHLQPTRWLPGKEGQPCGETDGWLRDVYLMEWVEGTLMPALVMVLVANMLKTAPVPFFIRWIPSTVADQMLKQLVPRAKDQISFLERQLEAAPGGGPFVAGDKLSGSDFMILFPLQASAGRIGINAQSHPKITEYVAKLESFDSYKRGIQRIKDEDGKFDGVAL